MCGYDERLSDPPPETSVCKCGAETYACQDPGERADVRLCPTCSKIPEACKCPPVSTGGSKAENTDMTKKKTTSKKTTAKKKTPAPKSRLDDSGLQIANPDGGSDKPKSDAKPKASPAETFRNFSTAAAPKPKARTFAVKFNRQGGGGPTCSIGVVVSLGKFDDPNDICGLLTCAELECTLKCDTSSGRGKNNDAAGQSTLIDSSETLRFIGKTGRLSLGTETCSFSLQVNYPNNRDACEHLIRFAGRDGSVTVKKVGTISEAEADGPETKTP